MVYLAGTFESSDAGIGVTGDAQSVGAFDAFVAALNPVTGAAHPFFGIGGIQTFGGSEDDGAAAIALAGERLFVSGGFKSNNAGIGRSGTIGSGGDSDAFVLQLDAFTGGAFDFASTTLGGSSDDAAFAIAPAGETVFAAGSSFSSDAGIGGSGTLDALPWNGFLLGVPVAANDVPSLGNFDTDGDNFPDEVEAAMGTPPSEFILSPAGFDAGLAGRLKVRSLTIKLNFTTPDSLRDSLTVRAQVPIPAGFSPAGQPVAVSVGGVVRRFVLDAHGVAVTGASSFKLSLKKTRGQALAQDAAFTATFKRSSMRTLLDDENLTGSATIAKPGAARSVAAIVVIGDGFFRNDVPLNYTAVAAKSGTAVGP
jgi:hypothetical protein